MGAVRPSTTAGRNQKTLRVLKTQAREAQSHVPQGRGETQAVAFDSARMNLNN